MPKISVIIPHYPLNEELNTKLDECVKSLKGYNELILVVNQGIGFGKAVNWGLRMAKGDYLIVVSNDDTVEGNLEDLCDFQSVTTPIVNNIKQEFWGTMFCLPRWVYDKIGGFDEQFELAFFEDDDYIMRLRQAKIPMKPCETVKVRTLGSQTVKAMDINPYNDNRQKFIKKWGVDSSNPVRYDF